jgi:hypothetical protein
MRVDPNAHTPTRDVVMNRVLEQVRDQPDEQPAITADHRGCECDVELEPGRGGLRPMRSQRVLRDCGQVDRLSRAEPALSLSEHEQGVDQVLLLLALLERLPARFPEGVGRRRRVGYDHLE